MGYPDAQVLDAFAEEGWETLQVVPYAPDVSPDLGPGEVLIYLQQQVMEN